MQYIISVELQEVEIILRVELSNDIVSDSPSYPPFRLCPARRMDYPYLINDLAVTLSF